MSVNVALSMEETQLAPEAPAEAPDAVTPIIAAPEPGLAPAAKTS